MAEVIVVGGGVAGLCGGLLLARDGHRVRLLERDPAPPHDLGGGVDGVGAARGGPVPPDPLLPGPLPPGAGGRAARCRHRPGGRRRAAAPTPWPRFPRPSAAASGPATSAITILTGRRPVVEAAIAAVAEAESGLEVRRGVGVPGPAHRRRRAGVRCPTWSAWSPRTARSCGPIWWSTPAAGGRRCRAGWPRSGARPPEEELEDSRLRLLRPPLPLVRRLPAGGLRRQPPALRLGVDPDAAGRQRHLGCRPRHRRRRRHAAAGPPRRGVGAGGEELPAGRPLAGRRADLGRRRDGQHRGPPPPLLGRRRPGGHRRGRPWPTRGPAPTRRWGGAPRWACCTPSVCATCCARRSPRRRRRTPGRLEPTSPRRSSSRFYRDTLAFDRHRLAEVEAEIAGLPYETDDPGWLLGQALRRGAVKDPELLRGYLTVAFLLERGVDVLSRPGLAERALGAGSARAGAGPEPGRAGRHRGFMSAAGPGPGS